MLNSIIASKVSWIGQRKLWTCNDATSTESSVSGSYLREVKLINLNPNWDLCLRESHVATLVESLYYAFKTEDLIVTDYWQQVNNGASGSSWLSYLDNL